MRRSFPLFLVIAAASGCYTSHDGLTAPPRDGGPALDAGMVTIADAAMPRRDAAAARDAGAVVCDGPLPPFEGPTCGRETIECLSDCTTPDCTEGCFAGDPACPRCLNDAVVRCANTMGCQSDWSEFACCAVASGACAGRRGIDLLQCGAPVCPDELERLGACVTEVIDMSPECEAAADEACVR
ncbi:hypothetical protein [Sandaracinus amylolyticus]|uniref:hypothetical protein n=1 Tax=Sandaracinus amylolyticus TaxID=927083 RepID=UPI001F2D8871|nr:hypothetical protein [Sandaracinus amylolyticus]